MTDKMLVAQGVANRLFATESAIDAALAEASGLMAEMVAGRGELRISATVGQDAGYKVAEAIATLAQARRAVVEAHHELQQVKLSIGIRSKMLGEHQKDAHAPSTTHMHSIAS